jgi:hypothetical protein
MPSCRTNAPITSETQAMARHNVVKFYAIKGELLLPNKPQVNDRRISEQEISTAKNWLALAGCPNILASLTYIARRAYGAAGFG